MTNRQDHRYALQPGHRLREYRVDRYLGSGGFGITYLATDENLALQVAIKEYLPSNLAMRDADNSVVVKTSEDEDDFEWGRERFLDEARSLARFNHPNIVRVQRFFEAHGTSYIVMDYVEGQPVSKLLERKGTLTEAEIRRSVLPLADGLAAVHDANLLHRDIKPSNIVTRDDGTPVLIDFGSARQAVGLKSRSLTSLVTPGYAPLEQYSAKSRQGPATDIYAFAAVLYRCVMGKVPDDATERAVEDLLTPTATAAIGGYSPDMLAAIDTALALRMEERPQSVGALLRAMGEVDASPKAQGSGSANVRHDLTSAEGRHEEAEYGSALSALQHSAELGNPNAQYCLGCCYHDGKGVLRDRAQAAHWFLEAAEQGHADAQHSLGLLCHSGQGLPKDDAQAAQWFRKAAHQGLRDAQECLGLMCLRGEGMPKDYEEAALWLTKAADQGQDISFTRPIGWEIGKGVPEVTAEVVKWFQIAAEKESTDAQLCLGVMYSRGQGVPQDFGKALHWFESAASRGFASAEYYLGQDSSLGLSEPHDYAQAIRWFRAASAHGHSGARLKLQSTYENGDGVPKDDEQAVLWFRRAAEGGCANAQYCLGKMFLSGDRVPDDDGQAIFWIRRAAQQGLADAQYHLGEVLLSGQLVLEDDRYDEDVTGKWLRNATEQQRPTAIQWIRKAAEQGLAKAQYHLGCMYRTGHYVRRDQALAVQWLLRAAGEGHYGAERDLHILLHHVWVPAEETGLSPEIRRALTLPGHSPRDEFALLDRLRAKLKWLIEDSKEQGDFDKVKHDHPEDHPWIQSALNDCLSNTEEVEASCTMQSIAKQALQQGASEPTEDDYGQLEYQRLRDWLNDLNEGLRHWDSGDQ